MNKKLIAISVVIPIALVSGIAASAYFSSECKYDPLTGYYVVGEKVYAHGTMEDAWACALEGLLPQSVMDRLGEYGHMSIQAEAQRIIMKNEEMKKQRKEK